MEWNDLTFLQRIGTIVNAADRIAVRAEVNGKWQSLFISELPESLMIREIERLANRNVPPVTILPDC